MKNFFLILCIISLAILTQSCSDKKEIKNENSSTVKQEFSQDTAKEISIDKLNGSCPYLTDDGKGNAVLSWIRDTDKSNHVMCYAVSKDHGKTFGGPVVIPGSEEVYPHGENLPKIIFRPDGAITAAWGVSNPNPKNPYSGLVFYTQSFDEGKTWTKARSLSNDASSIDQRYFDMAVLSKDQTAIVWLDSRTNTSKEGSSLYYAVAKGNSEFNNEKSIGMTCCQCCRTSLAIDKKGNIHIAYRGIIQDSIRDMVHTVSTDGGITFTDAKRISYDNWVINACPHAGPDMVVNDKGLNFVWYTMGGGKGAFYSRSIDNGNTFSERTSIDNNPNSKHPQASAFENGNLLLAWDEGIESGKEFNNRIGLQIRNADGEPLSIKFITSKEKETTFPVIKIINSSTVIIAYTQKLENSSEPEGKQNIKSMKGMDHMKEPVSKTHVMYQLLAIK